MSTAPLTPCSTALYSVVSVKNISNEFYPNECTFKTSFHICSSFSDTLVHCTCSEYFKTCSVLFRSRGNAHIYLHTFTRPKCVRTFLFLSISTHTDQHSAINTKCKRVHRRCYSRSVLGWLDYQNLGRFSE